MKLWLTRTSRDACMLTTLPPVYETVNGTDRTKVFVRYGDPIGTKNLCMAGILKLMPDLRLAVLESKEIEITATVFQPLEKKVPTLGTLSPISTPSTI